MTVQLETSKSANKQGLLHRLNGQLLMALDSLMRHLLQEQWQIENWIINVLMLDRSLKYSYSAKLKTSAIFHRGELVAEALPAAEMRQNVLRLEQDVPLDESFSGHCISTGDIVWIDDLHKLQNQKDELARRYARYKALANLYRRYDFVLTRGPELPKAEYVFPILLEVGLIRAILGVLNLEFLPLDLDSPFSQVTSPGRGQERLEPGQKRFESTRLIVVDAITELLEAHAPFVHFTSLPEIQDMEQRVCPSVQNLLALHADVMSNRVQSLKA